jgi:hypothetical protein
MPVEKRRPTRNQTRTRARTPKIQRNRGIPLHVRPAPEVKPRILQAVEGHKELTRRELIWAVKTPKFLEAHERDLVEIPSDGDHHSQEFETDDIPDNTPYVMHTHLSPRAMREYGKAKGLPSFMDVATLSVMMRQGKSRQGIVAAIDWHGKVVGYTVFKLNKPMTQQLERILREISSELQGPGDIGSGGRGRMGRMRPAYREQPLEAQLNGRAMNELIRELLEHKGYRLTQVARPMPGYWFNPETCEFEEEKLSRSKILFPGAQAAKEKLLARFKARL